MKKIFKFIIILIPWFLSSLLFNDNSYYQTLNLPFFALPGKAYGIVWSILYILISISIYKIYEKYSFNNTKDYFKSLTINYIFNQIYTFFLFGLNNLFLSFIDSLLILITSINLYDETKELDDKASKYLIPYIIFNVFATILSITIYFMNI